MTSEENEIGDSLNLNDHARAWEEGFNAGQAASKSPSTIDIARVLASAAEAAANASKLLAEAVVIVLGTAGALKSGQSIPKVASSFFKKSPSTFSKPPSVFSKPPSTHSLGHSKTDESPWSGSI